MTEYEERPPTALAHGPAKSSDIERVRQDLVNDAEKLQAQKQEASAARRLRKHRRREAQREPDAPD